MRHYVLAYKTDITKKEENVISNLKKPKKAQKRVCERAFILYR